MPKSGFLYCHLLIPSVFCMQESQDSSRWLSPGRVTGGPYSPEPHRGWASVVLWGLPALCSQPLYLKAEIKAITLNKTEGYFEIKSSAARMPSPFVKDHLTLLHNTTRKLHFQKLLFYFMMHLDMNTFWPGIERCSVPPDRPWGTGHTAPPDCRGVKTQKAPGVQTPMAQLFKHLLPTPYDFPAGGTPEPGS